MPVAAIREPQPLRDPSGTVAAYFVPADEFEAMRTELSELREKAAKLQRQRDHYIAKLEEALRTLIPVPLSDEVLAGPVENPNAVRDILAKLDAG
jgi:hypothetical protein